MKKDQTLPSIESIGLPLVYKVSPAASPGLANQQGQPGAETEGVADSQATAAASRTGGADSEAVTVRVEARALEGMQKEALVHHALTDTTWRMVSDEGPYLNGTDLAPFPLAFYAAGMAFSYLSELERHAAARQLLLDSVRLQQDNYYSMQGSAIRGDMIGGALPSELAVSLDSGAAPDQLAEIVRTAAASSPAQSYMNDVLRNTFWLEANGQVVPVTEVAACSSAHHADPAPRFEAVAPAPSDSFNPEIISKRTSAEAIEGVEGGAGSSLRSEQKRTLHVHAEAWIREDGLREAEVQLFKPIGSTFRFIGDESSQAAPPSLAYLAAGVGFCYMTQLGRYAEIVKQELDSYRIVQDNLFRPGRPEAPAAARPVDTHLFVTLNDSDEGAQRLLRMGERTCFLHAAMRSSNRSKLTATLNGQPLALD